MQRRRIGRFPQHDPQRVALNDTVADRSEIECLGQYLTTLLRNANEAIGASGHARSELLRRAVEFDTAVVEQQHGVAAFRLIEICGRPHHRHTVMGQLRNHSPQILTADGIDSDAGFVEQQHRRPRHQRTCQAQLLFHTAGQFAGAAIAERLQPRELQQL